MAGLGVQASGTWEHALLPGPELWLVQCVVFVGEEHTGGGVPQ